MEVNVINRCVLPRSQRFLNNDNNVDRYIKVVKVMSTCEITVLYYKILPEWSDFILL